MQSYAIFLQVAVSMFQHYYIRRSTLHLANKPQ